MSELKKFSLVANISFDATSTADAIDKLADYFDAWGVQLAGGAEARMPFHGGKISIYQGAQASDK